MALTSPSETTSGATEPKRVGRKRDHSRDAVILDAALDALAEDGYEGMTMDSVALRARAGKATMYRRWPSKAHLVVDAVVRMGQRDLDLANLPDAGSLREDLRALIGAQDGRYVGEQRVQVMAALVSMLATDTTGLAQAAHAATLTPWIDANRILLQRAVDRGEISADLDLQTLARVVPSMAMYRSSIERREIDDDFLHAVIDGVLLPAVKLQPPDSG